MLVLCCRYAIYHNFDMVILQVVSDDGKKVRRQQSFTELEMEELQVTYSLFYLDLSLYVLLT